MPLDDYSAKAFNRLVRYYHVLDAFIAVRASPYKRAYFLRYLDATKYDPNSYVSNVRLRKDANKVKRSLLTITTFRKEPIVAATPDDSNDDKDGEDKDDLLDAANAIAYRRNDSESSLDSEGSDAPGPNSAASGPNSATSAVAITAASS
ncbi:hypothetical protein D6C78_10843 [Aureobasidium pullulans]|uniref:Uncharacterized protein n=1 Tax=Aureobasidium pullulans TaxID=5580 RepID=A0A4T0B9A4_AURPU|nr:hypothetical protein D6C78_10843 [Aureobasidium pullulans]